MNEIQTELLPVPLTREEVRLKGELMARLSRDRSTAATDQKNLQADWKAKDKDFEEQLRVLVHEINERAERRPVRVHKTPAVDRRCWEFSREDTGAVIRTEPMTPAEYEEGRQGRLFREATVHKLPVSGKDRAAGEPEDEPLEAEVQSPDEAVGQDG